MKKIRVCICDDHALFREGVKAVLRDDPRIDIVGEAADGKQAVELIRRVHPDLLGNFPDAIESATSVEGVKSSALAELEGIGATAISLCLLGIVLHAFALGGIWYMTQCTKGGGFPASGSSSSSASVFAAAGTPVHVSGGDTFRPSAV